MKLARTCPGGGAVHRGVDGRAVEAYYPAIEIVDDRYAKWETLGAPTLVADDFFAAGCVLGEAVRATICPTC